MKYEVELNNVLIELPKYNLSISDKIESVESYINSDYKFKDKCKKIYDFISFLITKEEVQNILGSLNELDPNELNILYLSVVDEYNKPTESYNSEKGIKRIEELRDTVGIINDIANASDKIK